MGEPGWLLGCRRGKPLCQELGNLQMLLPPGTNPQPYVRWPDFARGSLLVRTVGVSSYDSLQAKFQRRYHSGLQFLLSYTLGMAKTNAGDQLSGEAGNGLNDFTSE